MEQLVSVLEMTLVSNNEQVRLATQTLSRMASGNPEYGIWLMGVVDRKDYKYELRMAALAQLKRLVSTRWNQSTQEIQWDVAQAERSGVQDLLFRAFISTCQDDRFLKLYKSIVSELVDLSKGSFLPTKQVLIQLKTGQYPVQILALHFAQAVANPFRQGLQYTSKCTDQMMIELLPELLRLNSVANVTEDIVYLSSKLIWKLCSNNLTSKGWAALKQWLPRIFGLMSSEPPTISSLEEIKPKTPHFYYFHTKKWLSRLLYKCIQSSNSKNLKIYCEQVERFNQEYFKQIMTVLCKVLQQVSVPKCHYFLITALKLMYASKCQQMMEGYMDQLLYLILPNYIQITPKQDELARANSAEFIRMEDDKSRGFTNLKGPSLMFWQMVHLNKDKANLTRLQKSFQFILTQFRAESDIHKQLGLQLLIHLQRPFSNAGGAPLVLNTSVKSLIIPLLRSNTVVLAIRSAEFIRSYADRFSQMSGEGFPIAVGNLCQCIINSQCLCLRVRAAEALGQLLQRHPKATCSIIKTVFTQLVRCILYLMQRIDYQHLVNVLKNLVKNFHNQSNIIAVDLIEKMCSLFIKYIGIMRQRMEQQDHSKNFEGSESDAEFAADSCLVAIQNVLMGTLSKQSLLGMERFLIPLFSQCFSIDQRFFQNCTHILGLYLFQVQVISPALWFFYPLCIYYVIGMKDAPSLQQVYNPMQTKIFTNLTKQRFQYTSAILIPLRVYINKGIQQLLQGATDYFGVKLICLLFCLVENIIQDQDDEDNFRSQGDKASALALLTYLLECTDNKEVAVEAWKVCQKVYGQDGDSDEDIPTCVRQMTLQLQSLALFRAPLQLLPLSNKSSKNIATRYLIGISGNSKSRHQVKRLILGIFTVIRHYQLTSSQKLVVPLFRQAVGLIRDQTDTQTPNSSSQEDQQFSGYDIDDWEQKHNQCYIDQLLKVSEQEFMNDSIKVVLGKGMEVAHQLAAQLSPQQQAAILQRH